jgi:hypothetical protein
MNGGIIQNKDNMNKFSFFNRREKNLPIKEIVYGGIGSVVNTKQKIFELLGSADLKLNDIVDFSVDSFNNLRISLNANREYGGFYLRNDGNYQNWIGSNELTFIYDVEGTIIDYQTVFCSGQDNNKIAIMATDEVISFGFRRNTSLKRVIYSKANIFTGQSHFEGCTNLQRVDLRKVTSADRVYRRNLYPFENTSGVQIYANPNWEDEEGLKSAFDHAVYDRGATVIKVLNDINPNPVLNLQLTNITNNSVDISFDSSLNSENTIDFYDVYLYDGNLLTKINPNKEIDTNSTTISGLNSNTQYQILIRAVDIYLNFSEYTESNQFTTL